jgi:hypothetical protein
MLQYGIIDIKKSMGDIVMKICVERSVAGNIEWLPLADQHHYREWAGCFTLLPSNYGI